LTEFETVLKLKNFKRRNKIKRVKPLAAALMTILFTFLFLSCSSKPPEIMRIIWQINAMHDTETSENYETLSLFVDITDPDGIDDIDSLYLINDNRELYWELTAEDWEKKTVANETWIGSNSILMPDGSALPRGEYRILVRDTGGDSDERTLLVNTPAANLSRAYFPTLSFKNNIISIRGFKTAYNIWAYGKDGKFITSFNLNTKSVKLTGLTRTKPIISDGFTCYVYTYSPGLKRGLISGPYYIETSK